MAAEKKEEFVNPYNDGVTYAEFQKALGKKTVKEYAKGHLNDAQIKEIENELQTLNQ